MGTKRDPCLAKKIPNPTPAMLPREYRNKKGEMVKHASPLVQSMASSRTPEDIAAIKANFIAGLRQHANVTEALSAVPIHRRTLYDWRKKDPDFAAAWHDAKQEAIDKLEMEAWRRGCEGFERDIIYQGEKRGTTIEYSDRMLELMLKGHRPERFKDRTELTGKVGLQVEAVRSVLVHPDGAEEEV